MFSRVHPVHGAELPPTSKPIMDLEKQSIMTVDHVRLGLLPV